MAVLAPVAALDAGCGGQADKSEEPIRTSQDAGDELDACPERAPAIGSACSRELLMCPYDDLPDTNSYCPDPGRYCLDGAWRSIPIGCNPPRPTIETCPESVPEFGSSCASFLPGLTCNYPYCYGLAPTARCGAESLLWEDVPRTSCNPPAPQQCPSQPPVLGSDCYPEDLQCAYGTCGDPNDPPSTPLCQDGVWVQLEVVLCPTPGVDAGVGQAADAGASDAGVADGG
jgi:hypothetical protein